MIVIVGSLKCRRTDILDVGESILDVGEQTVGETTVIGFWQILPNLLLFVSVRLFFPFFFPLQKFNFVWRGVNARNVSL